MTITGVRLTHHLLPCLLPDDAIHIWHASLNQPASRFHRLARTLSTDERERAARFYFEQDRQRFIVGRGILRAILSAYLGIEPQSLRFRYGLHGKPALAERDDGGSTLRFNVSHSEDVAFYAVTRQWEIGVDVEHVRPLADAGQIARRFFSPREYATLEELAPHEMYEAFFGYWTCKEALVKAIGDGLFWPLNQLDIAMPSEVGKPATLLSIGGNVWDAQHWSLQQLVSPSGFAAALAVEGHHWRVSYKQWPGDVLTASGINVP